MKICFCQQTLYCIFVLYLNTKLRLVFQYDWLLTIWSTFYHN